MTEGDGHRNELEDVWKTMQRNPYAFAVGLFSAIICSSTSILAVYHCHLVSKQETTNESVKKTFEGSGNPYDSGCALNWKAVYCAKRVPSQIVATAMLPSNEDTHSQSYHQYRDGV